MDVAHVVLLVLHIGGVVALLAGILVQVRRPEKKVNGLMRDGVGTAFVAGLFLVGVLEAGDDPVDHTKIAVKFAIGLVLLVLVMANLRPLLGAPRAHPRQRRGRARLDLTPAGGRVTDLYRDLRTALVVRTCGHRSVTHRETIPGVGGRRVGPS
jgi:hypothetical protein